MGIKYIADLSIRTDYPPELALAALEFDRANNIYHLVTGTHPTGTYWTDWGGAYDTPLQSDAEIYFSQFLQKVTSRAALIAAENSLLIEGNEIFMNLSRKPWQYSQSDTEYDRVQGYASIVRDETKPSDINYLDAVSEDIPHPVKLLIPSVPNKLSDPISGTSLQTTFNFSLINNDGTFDDIEENNITNTPAKIKRSDVENPELADFNIIRKGLADSVTVDGKIFKVIAADITRTLTESATRKFNTDIYPSLPASTIDKDIPLGWGDLDNVPLFEVNTGEYIALDPLYITAVAAVYDSDGVSISFTFDSGTGIISATDAETADVTGKASNLIGEIITSEIEDKSNIPYTEGPWDKTETDLYIAISAELNFYFRSGEVKKLVKDVLKNDNAFLFTKNDGRLTLRQWGQSYTEHIIDSWRIMKLPSKSNSEGKKYFISSAAIKYGRDQDSGVYNLEFFDDTQERAISEIYNKKKPGTFPTDLHITAEIEDLAERLLNRFGNIAEVAKVDLGYNTLGIDLLDTVILDLDINGRIMSNFNVWIVREVDAAQDALSLESFDKVTVSDIILGDTGGNMILGETSGDMILGVPYIMPLE